jgi:hypothetical protein
MEFLSVLEKALSAVKRKAFSPKPLDDPFANSLAEIWIGIFQDQTARMIDDIEKILAE